MDCLTNEHLVQNLRQFSETVEVASSVRKFNRHHYPYNEDINFLKFAAAQILNSSLTS